MNKIDNLDSVREVGDSLQLEFGTEFGYYAKNISKEQIQSFCAEASVNPVIQKHGFMFLADFVEYKDRFCITARNISRNLNIPVRLFDNSVFFMAKDNEWFHINEEMFVTLQKLWRKFIAKHSWEYQKHLNMLDVLDKSEACLSL